MHVGQTIHEQLKDLNLYSHLAFNRYGTKASLIEGGLKIVIRGSKNRNVIISYNEGSDTYDVGMFTTTGEKISEHKEVYVDQMALLIVDDLEQIDLRMHAPAMA